MSSGNGVERYSFHNTFIKEISDVMVKHKWMNDEKKFYKMTFDVCKTLGYKYNESKSHLGDTANARRHFIKNKTTSKNDEWICITNK